MIIITVYQIILEEIKMKGIKLILLSTLVVAMLTSCGMRRTNTTTSPSPQATHNGNVSNTNDGTVSNDANNAVNHAGEAVQDVGEGAGNAARDVGDAAGDVVEGVGDAARDVTDGTNNNGR